MNDAADAEKPKCAWKRAGDFCLRPVERVDQLCDHHAKLAQELNEVAGAPDAIDALQPEPPPVPQFTRGSRKGQKT